MAKRSSAGVDKPRLDRKQAWGVDDLRRAIRDLTKHAVPPIEVT